MIMIILCEPVLLIQKCVKCQCSFAKKIICCSKLKNDSFKFSPILRLFIIIIIMSKLVRFVGYIDNRQPMKLFQAFIICMINWINQKKVTCRSQSQPISLTPGPIITFSETSVSAHMAGCELWHAESVVRSWLKLLVSFVESVSIWPQRVTLQGQGLS